MASLLPKSTYCTSPVPFATPVRRITSSAASLVEAVHTAVRQIEESRLLPMVARTTGFAFQPRVTVALCGCMRRVPFSGLLSLLILVLAFPAAGGSYEVTSVVRSLQVTGVSDVTATHFGTFNKDLYQDNISGDTVIAHQYVRHDSGPFTATDTLWSGDGRAEIVPVEHPVGRGSVAKSSLHVTFEVFANIQCEFSCSVTGMEWRDSVELQKSSGASGIHVSVQGNDPIHSYQTPGRITLTPGTYHLRASCYTVGSAEPDLRSGSFHFELQFYPPTCVQKRSLPIPADFGCASPSGPLFSSPQFANGRLEMQCVTPSCSCASAVQVRWVYPSGEARYIGLARYTDGVIGCDYNYDACSGVVTEVSWSNAEGYAPSPDWYRLPVQQDECHGMAVDRYDTDVYVFRPDIRRLQVSHFFQALDPRGQPVGPVYTPLIFISFEAPTDFCDLFLRFAPWSDGQRLCPAPAQFLPRHTFTRVFGTAHAGHVFLNYRDLRLALLLQGGESADLIAAALAQRVNANTNFAALGITATNPPSSLTEAPLLILANAADEDLSISATGQDTNGVRFIGRFDYPALHTTWSATHLTLSWATNFPGFLAETTTNLAAPQSWTRVAGMPTVTNGTNRLTSPIEPGSHFFRLRLP